MNRVHQLASRDGRGVRWFRSARLDISVSILQFDDDAGDAVLEEEADWDSYDQLSAWQQR